VNDQPGTVDRADLEDRLATLRAVLALTARDLAEARRQVNPLAAENRRLRPLIRALEHEDVGAVVSERHTDPDAGSILVPS
jgi:hypothetical protein